MRNGTAWFGFGLGFEFRFGFGFGFGPGGLVRDGGTYDDRCRLTESNDLWCHSTHRSHGETQCAVRPGDGYIHLYDVFDPRETALSQVRRALEAKALG